MDNAKKVPVLSLTSEATVAHFMKNPKPSRRALVARHITSEPRIRDVGLAGCFGSDMQAPQSTFVPQERIPRRGFGEDTTGTPVLSLHPEHLPPRVATLVLDLLQGVEEEPEVVDLEPFADPDPILISFTSLTPEGDSIEELDRQLTGALARGNKRLSILEVA